MIRNSLVIFSVLLTVATASLASAGTPSENAFQMLKRLEGKWKATSRSGQVFISETQIVGKGSAIVQKEMDMVNIYTLDNDSILLTHYCEAQNQPRFRAKVKAETARLEFEFVDVTGNAKNGYINNVILQFMGDDRIIEHWSYEGSDGKKHTETFTLEKME